MVIISTKLSLCPTRLLLATLLAHRNTELNGVSPSLPHRSGDAAEQGHLELHSMKAAGSEAERKPGVINNSWSYVKNYPSICKCVSGKAIWFDSS